MGPSGGVLTDHLRHAAWLWLFTHREGSRHQRLVNARFPAVGPFFLPGNQLWEHSGLWVATLLEQLFDALEFLSAFSSLIPHRFLVSFLLAEGLVVKGERCQPVVTQSLLPSGWFLFHLTRILTNPCWSRMACLSPSVLGLWYPLSYIPSITHLLSANQTASSITDVGHLSRSLNIGMF